MRRAMSTRVMSNALTRRSTNQLALAMLMALALVPAAAHAQVFEEFVDFHPTLEQFDFDEWPYKLQGPVNERIQALARQHPNIARAHHIGNSQQGQELWMLEITNFDTGPGESKPGLWLEAGIHPDELPGLPYMRYVFERLIAMYGQDPVVTRLVDTRTFYVLPDLNPDAHRIVLSAHPAWPGHKPEEHPGKDLNGDGYITQMRWKENAADEEHRILTEGQLPDSPEHEDSMGYVWRQRSDTRWEMKDRERHWTGRREQPDYNRQWAEEWSAADPGAGDYPFSVPEVYAVAKAITDRRNIFFFYDVHSANVGREFMIRPLSNMPYQSMHHEDNDWYVRLAAAWAHISPGDPTLSDYYTPDGTGGTIGGLPPDWAYLHQGIFGLGGELGGTGRDYDGNGEVLPDELERWHEEEMGGRYAQPWEPYDHPVLGAVEIGGPHVSSQGQFPPAIGDLMEDRTDKSFKFLMYVAGLAPEVNIVEVTSEVCDDGTHRVSATIRNEGWISTYVTRRALEIGGATTQAGPGAALNIRRREFPVVVEIEVYGGELVEGDASQDIGHLLGKLAHIRQWADEGEDLPAKTVQWRVRPTGDGPVTVRVRASAHKSGSDEETLTLGAQQ